MSRGKGITVVLALVLTHAAVYLAAKHSSPVSAVPIEAGATAAVSKGKSGDRDRMASPHGRLWQKLLEKRVGRADFEKAREDLLKEWMIRDLGAVLDLIYGPDASPNFGNTPLGETLDQQIAKQQEEVIRWIREGRFGSRRQEMFSRWYSALVRMERQDLILAALPQATSYEKSWAFSCIVATDKIAVLDQVRSALLGWYRDDPRQAGLLKVYGRKKVDLAKGETAALFVGETDPGLRKALGEGWVEARFAFKPTAERIGELRELPEDARSLAVESVMNYFADRHLAGVGPALEEMNRLQMWGELASDGARQAVLVCAEVRGEQRQLLESLKGISDDGARTKLFASAGKGMGMGGWGEASFEAVYEALPAGSDRDNCLAGIVNAMWERGDKGPAKLGFQGIADQGLKAELLRRMPELEK
ncbi:hypothetical protein [Haloferula sp. BvORR071]|uniref:hypothetical protein n=1 Tax=Haloferula sp. BvORR071 TaxID=1396141 RepID=UPI000553AF2A|nr:hypothetical protein [Haloferula sp. BvORR071]